MLVKERKAKIIQPTQTMVIRPSCKGRSRKNPKVNQNPKTRIKLCRIKNQKKIPTKHQSPVTAVRMEILTINGQNWKRPTGRKIQRVKRQTRRQKSRRQLPKNRTKIVSIVHRMLNLQNQRDQNSSIISQSLEVLPRMHQILISPTMHHHHRYLLNCQLHRRPTSSKLSKMIICPKQVQVTGVEDEDEGVVEGTTIEDVAADSMVVVVVIIAMAARRFNLHNRCI
jgi:hypothetical protein